MPTDLADDAHAELREGVRATCAPFDGAYHQEMARAQRYPRPSSRR